jgi:Flp pilus assembly protein CpaB
VSQRRTLILVAAVVVGALASFLVWNYVNGVQDEAFNNAEQVPVYLVKTAVSRGTPGLEAQAYIAKENIPRKFKPGNAITNIEDISGKVALNNLVPNQVVVSDMFVDASDPGARASFAERLTRVRNEDQVAITINVDDVHGVAGLVQPGDFVNILVTNVVTADKTGKTADNSSAGTSATPPLFASAARYLYQKVEILAVGTNALPQPGDKATAAGATDTTVPTSGGGLLTLMVPSRAAQYIASIPTDQLYLTLVARDYKPVTQTDIPVDTPLPAEDATAQTPYGPKGPESSG